MINNAEWLDGLNYLEFLRDIGRHFSVNRMLSFEIGQVAAGPGTKPVVPGIQLHDPAGL